MSQHTDPDFLSDEQYNDSEGLDIRNKIQDAYRTHLLPWFRWVFEKLSFPPVARLLELGCGSGSLWTENRALLPGGWRVVLSDLSPGMAADAREKIRSNRPENTVRFDFAVINADAAPFNKEQFDGIVALGLLDHLPNRNKALNEISRLLKPGGVFVTSAGGRSHLQEIEQLVRPFLPDIHFGGDPERFGLDNGRRLLSNWFAQLERVQYDNDLVLDRSDAVLAYILSEAQVRATVDKQQWSALRRSVEDQLDKQGKIRVTTSKGLFIGTKKT